MAVRSVRRVFFNPPLHARWRIKGNPRYALHAAELRVATRGVAVSCGVQSVSLCYLRLRKAELPALKNYSADYEPVHVGSNAFNVTQSTPT
jgi:hypothetical protein